MRIAIVDDIMSERKNLRDRLGIQLSRHSLHAEIFEYENGESFLTAAEYEHFHIVFLDIYMSGTNGVKIAEKLRAFDPNCILVFTTTSTDHALDGFRVRAFQYLVKPYSEKDLEILFNEITERLPVPDKYIDVRIVGGIVRLRFKEILYAEHFQHRIHIYSTNEKKTITRQTFSEFSASLNDERFFLCSRGVIVNLEYVDDFDGTAFILKNGKSISVSRDLAKSARFAFGDFLFKRGHK